MISVISRKSHQTLQLRFSAEASKTKTKKTPKQVTPHFAKSKTSDRVK